jgi:hypothetical protein
MLNPDKRKTANEVLMSAVKNIFPYPVLSCICGIRVLKNPRVK